MKLFNRTLGIYFLSGILAGFITNGWLADTAVASEISSYLSTLRDISNSSPDPDSWLSYFTIMILLYIVFIPLAAFSLAKEIKTMPIGALPYQLLLFLLCIALLWFFLIGATSFSDGSLPLHPSGRGAALASFMFGSRFGLALVGSGYMAVVFALFSFGFVGVPIAMYKQFSSELSSAK